MYVGVNANIVLMHTKSIHPLVMKYENMLTLAIDIGLKRYSLKTKRKLSTNMSENASQESDSKNGQLTDAQKARIEKNKQRALELRQAR